MAADGEGVQHGHGGGHNFSASFGAVVVRILFWKEKTVTPAIDSEEMTENLTAAVKMKLSLLEIF